MFPSKVTNDFLLSDTQTQSFISLMHDRGLEATIAHYTELAETTSSVYSYFYLGIAHLLNNDIESAEMTWMSAITIFAQDRDAVRTLSNMLEAVAVKLFQYSQVSKAEMIYYYLVGKGGDNCSHPLSRTIALLLQGANELAAELLLSLDAYHLQQHKLWHVRHYYLGITWFNRKAYKKTIPLMKAALTVDANFWAARYCLAYCLVEQGNLEEAQEQCSLLVDRQPNLIKSRFLLAYCYRKTGQSEFAIPHFEYVLKIDPDSEDALFHLAYCLRDVGQFEEAIGCLKRLQTLNPTKPFITRRLFELSTYKTASFVNPENQAWRVWDPILFKDDNSYYLVYLTSPAKGSPFWKKGSMAFATSPDLNTWQPLKELVDPDLKSHWESGRFLSGCLRKENEIYYLFYSAAPAGKGLMQEKIGLATSKDGVNWQRSPHPFLEIDDRFYDTKALDSRLTGSAEENTNLPLVHHSWRDPFVFYVSEDKKYYMFISTRIKTNNKGRTGCLGLAVSEQIDGPYHVQPPVLFPTINDSEDGIFTELERPQIIRRFGQYHLFFSCAPQYVNQKWLEEACQQSDNAIRNSSTFFWYQSDTISGPYYPSNDGPIVKGSSQAGLYATQLIEDFSWLCSYSIVELFLPVDR